MEGALLLSVPALVLRACLGKEIKCHGDADLSESEKTLSIVSDARGSQRCAMGLLGIYAAIRERNPTSEMAYLTSLACLPEMLVAFKFIASDQAQDAGGPKFVRASFGWGVVHAFVAAMFVTLAGKIEEDREASTTR